MQIKNRAANKWVSTMAPLECVVTVQDGNVIFCNRSFYEVPLNQCATYRQILCHVVHLCENQKVNTSTIYHFIKIACDENGYVILRNHNIYEVLLNQLPTYRQILVAVAHLCENPKVNKYFIINFIKIASEVNGLTVPM